MKQIRALLQIIRNWKIIKKKHINPKNNLLNFKSTLLEEKIKLFEINNNLDKDNKRKKSYISDYISPNNSSSEDYRILKGSKVEIKKIKIIILTKNINIIKINLTNIQ